MVRATWEEKVFSVGPTFFPYPPRYQKFFLSPPLGVGGPGEPMTTSGDGMGGVQDGLDNGGEGVGVIIGG